MKLTPRQRASSMALRALRANSANIYFHRPKIEYESKFDRIKRRLMERKAGTEAPQ